MKQNTVQSARNALFAVLLFGLVSTAYGTIRHVAGNGVDGAACGATATPCRSISRGILNAVAGDTVLVGPGRYGDLNNNGTLGDPGEETSSPGCDCMLAVKKSVILISSDGAAATLIDANNLVIGKAVLIMASDVEFGRPEHGFLVTNPAASGKGIVIDGTDVKVRGNQVLRTEPAGHGVGIEAVDNPAEIVLIEQNQVVGWNRGIEATDSGKKISRNQVSLNTIGIKVEDGSVVGNVATVNGDGILVSGAASVVGNAAYGNRFGFNAVSPFTGVIMRINMFANDCGLRNSGVTGLVAANNYWGAVTGPGVDPADFVCTQNNGTTTTTPFATSRFAVNPSFEP